MNGGPRPGAADDAVERVVLPNGLTVLLRRDTSAPVVAIVTHVKAGYFDESDDIAGISHVLEHMYFKGTPTRGPGDIARETKAAGGYLNAGTIYDRTSYYTVLPSSGFAAGLAVQFDAFAHSLIDSAELARELEVIIEEVRRKRDTPSAIAIEECFALLYDVHRMRRWRMGMPDALRTFTRESVSGFYRSHYVPSNTVLTIVGDIDTGDALREIERTYGALPAGAAPRDRGEAEPPRNGFRWNELVRDIGQSQFVMGWRTVPAHHRDTPALDLAASVLSAGRASRLYREVRERSLASGVVAYHYTPTDVGVFAVAAETPPERLPAAASAMAAEVQALRMHGPSAAELERVKRGVDARWWRRLESMEGQATYLAEWEAHGGWREGAAYLETLHRTTAEEIRAAASEYLSLDRAAVITMRSESAPSLAADLPGARDLLVDAPASAAMRRDATTVESPALVGLGVPAARVVDGISVFATDGGVPILVRRKAGAPMAYVQALFVGGVANETALSAGRTTLMTRASLQGTAHRDGPQLAEDIEALGGALGSVTGAEAFGWTMSVPTAYIGGALALLAEVVEEPALSQAALDTERAIAHSGLVQLRDDMSRRPAHLALEAAFGDHPYARPTLGTEAGLKASSTQLLRAWHERFVRSGHGAIVVVADASADEIAAAVRGAFRGLALGTRPTPPAVQWPSMTLERLEERDKAQTALALLVPGPRRADASRFAAGLLSTIASGLGGRFFDSLRDKQSLAYTVTLGARSLSASGWLTAYLACSPSKEDAARAGLIRECERFVNEPVAADELARAKAYTLGSLAIRQQSAASVLSDIADAWLFGTLEELADESQRIAAVTEQDLLDAARSSFDMDRAVWGVVRGRE